MKKLFTFAASLLASFSLLAVEPTLSLTASKSAIADWNATYDNVKVSVQGAALADKKPCGATVNEKTLSISSADSHWLEISSADGLSKIVIVGAANSSGTTDYSAPLCVCASAPFDSTITDIIEVHYTGYDKECVENQIELPEGTKSVRLYRRMKVNKDKTTVGSGDNWTPASATGNQTYNITYLEVYASDGTPVATYDVTYYANDGSGMTAEQVEVKKVADNLFPVPEGMKFIGWNTKADGTGTDYAPGTKLESNLTLYAQWAKVCFEPVYDLAGGVGTAEVTAATASIEGGKLIISDSKGTITLKPVTGEKFKNGDVIEIAGTVGNASKPFGVKIGSQTIQTENVTPVDPAAPTAGGSAKVSAVLTLAADAESIAIMRAGGTTTTLTSCVIKREVTCKEIVSTVEALKAVSINDEPLGETDFAKLLAERTLILEKSYVTAPVIKFTKHVVVTYEDESTKETDEVIEKTSQQSQASTWGAMVNIAGVAYSVYTVKATSYTVTYKEGEQVLGSELVVANGNPAEFAKYEKKPLATFDGWFKDAELTQKVESMAAEVISADVTFYAKFSKAYATSVNIEQWILDNGKDNAAFKTVLENAHIYYENINDLDSLNDLEKKDRNEPYLGLKLKAKGAKIAFNLKKGEDAVKVKFGQVSDSLLLSINGESRVLRVEDTKDSLWLGINPAIDRYVELITTTSATVVLKQIMINEAIAKVELPEQTVFPINITAENGKVTTAWEGKGDKHISAPAGVTVTLTFTPDKGFEFDGVTLDGEELKDVDSVYSFTMPAKAVAVVATFKQSATAIDNTDATAKAVKVLRDGQLVIEKNGVRYNAQGAVVR